jgi:hypothetical protein
MKNQRSIINNTDYTSKIFFKFLFVILIFVI